MAKEESPIKKWEIHFTRTSKLERKRCNFSVRYINCACFSRLPCVELSFHTGRHTNLGFPEDLWAVFLPVSQ